MKVEIEECKLIDNTYRRNGYMWTALTLIEASKDCEEFDLPLAAIPLDELYWKINNTYDFIFHAKRVEVVDEKYPIILDNMGCVCDGVHRVVKAILAGKETIKAKRLQRMPDADSYTKPE